MAEKIIQIIGMLLVLLPYSFFGFIPFTDDLKIKMKTFYFAFAGFSLVYIVVSLLFILSEYGYAANWNLYFAGMLTVCFIFCFFMIRVHLSKFLYVFLVIVTFAYYIGGFCNFLEIRFFPENFETIFSAASTGFHAVLLLIFSPFFIWFLKKQVKPVVNQADISAWKTMWIIPGIFLIITMVYMGSFESELISTWQYIVILLLFAFGSFIVYSVVLRMLRASDQNEKLMELTKELEHQQEVRDTLLQNISHDLRAPITVIHGAAEILSESELAEEDKRALSRITSRITQLKNMVEDLLELNTIESGRLRFRIESLDIPILLEDIALEYRPLCEKKGLYLHIEPVNGYILADNRCIWQVFDNLITNALKYTGTGGLTVSAMKQDDFCVFCIKDTGSGIPQDRLCYVFDRFYRCDDSGQGAGLGLSIVKSIIESMEGKVWAESEYGKGTAFFYTLKLNN